MDISGEYQAYIRHISGISQAYVRDISWISQANLRRISGIFQGYLRHISGIRHVSGSPIVSLSLCIYASINTLYLFFNPSLTIRMVLSTLVVGRVSEWGKSAKLELGTWSELAKNVNTLAPLPYQKNNLVCFWRFSSIPTNIDKH